MKRILMISLSTVVPKPKSWGRRNERKFFDGSSVLLKWWQVHHSATTSPLCPAFFITYLSMCNMPISPNIYILVFHLLVDISTCYLQVHPKLWDSPNLFLFLYLTWLLSSQFTRARKLSWTLSFPSAAQPKWLSTIKGPISSTQISSLMSVPSSPTSLLLLRPSLSLT